jgi:hypothetical protein
MMRAGTGTDRTATGAARSARRQIGVIVAGGLLAAALVLSACAPSTTSGGSGLSPGADSDSDY